MKDCIVCGGGPVLDAEPQPFTHSIMYFYRCDRCGYRTGYGVPGARPGGVKVTDQRARQIAANKWEADETKEKTHSRVMAKMGR